MDTDLAIEQIEEDASSFHMHESELSYSTENARYPPRRACLGVQSRSLKSRSGSFLCGWLACSWPLAAF